MAAFDYWRLCDELSVVQAALRICDARFRIEVFARRQQFLRPSEASARRRTALLMSSAVIMTGVGIVFRRKPFSE